jgi:hypothetical protein
MKITQLFESVYSDIEILSEGVNYGEMYNRIYKIHDILTNLIDNNPRLASSTYVTGFIKKLPASIEYAHKEIMSTFDRSDIRIWCIRILKISTLHTLEASVVERMDMDDDTRESIKRLIQEDLRKTSNVAGRTIDIQNTWEFESVMNLLVHFLSLEIPAIDDFRFEGQSPDEVYTHFSNIERDWNRKMQGLIPVESVDDDVKNIMDFGDGYAWYDLGKAFCEQEKKAMGHCANAPMRGDSNQTIISLRELVVEDNRSYYRSHLTFIFHKAEGEFGEMKGVENNKPEPIHHKYIIPLIMEPWVNSLKGGGYLEENNFKITDVSGWQRYVKEKPSLMELSEYVENFGVDDYVINKIEFDYGAEGRVDFSGGDRVLQLETHLNDYVVSRNIADSIENIDNEVEEFRSNYDDYFYENSKLWAAQELSTAQLTQVEKIFNDDDDSEEWLEWSEILTNDGKGHMLFGELMDEYRVLNERAVLDAYYEYLIEFYESPENVSLYFQSLEQRHTNYGPSTSLDVTDFNGGDWTVEKINGNSGPEFYMTVRIPVAELIEVLNEHLTLSDTMSVSIEDVRYSNFDYGDPDGTMIDTKEYQKNAQYFIDQYNK